MVKWEIFRKPFLLCYCTGGRGFPFDLRMREPHGEKDKSRGKRLKQGITVAPFRSNFGRGTCPGDQGIGVDEADVRTQPVKYWRGTPSSS